MWSTLLNSKKAFDSINRKIMFAVFRHYGIPEAIVNAISVLYKNSKSAVMVDGNLSDPFDVTTGVLQGHVLAPFLLVVLVDYLGTGAEFGRSFGLTTWGRPQLKLLLLLLFYDLGLRPISGAGHRKVQPNLAHTPY